MKLLAAIVLASILSSSAVPKSRDAPAPVLSIAYRTEGKFILLPVRLRDGKIHWFALDTASPHSVIGDSLASKLRLATHPGGSISGAAGRDIPVRLASPQVLKIGAFRWKVDEPWVLDLQGVSIRDVEGFVGADLLEDYVVGIDPDQGRLELLDPSTFRSPAGATALPLIKVNGGLFVDVRLDVRDDLSVTHRVRVDTGSEDSVNDPIVAQSAETRGTALGGLGGTIQGVSGVYQAVHLGPYTFRNVWGPGAPHPALGMELLRRFHLIFDVRRGQLYLLPARAFNEPVPPPE